MNESVTRNNSLQVLAWVMWGNDKAIRLFSDEDVAVRLMERAFRGEYPASLGAPAVSVLDAARRLHQAIEDGLPMYRVRAVLWRKGEMPSLKQENSRHHVMATVT